MDPLLISMIMLFAEKIFTVSSYGEHSFPVSSLALASVKRH